MSREGRRAWQSGANFADAGNKNATVSVCDGCAIAEDGWILQNLKQAEQAARSRFRNESPTLNCIAHRTVGRTEQTQRLPERRPPIHPGSM